MDQMVISVILPTYNEKDNIVALIDAIHHQLAGRLHEIIVVDDHSPDGTYDVVVRLADPRVKPILHDGVPGLAASISAGVKQAAGNVILVMDSDFDHDPRYIPLMVNALSEYDCVCASRFLPGGRMNGWFRALGSRLFNHFIRVMTGSPLTDHLYGFFMIKKAVLSQCPSDKIFFGYGDYYIRLLYYLEKNRVSILQFPAINGGRVRQKNFRFIKFFWQYFTAVCKLGPQSV